MTYLPDLGGGERHIGSTPQALHSGFVLKSNEPRRFWIAATEFDPFPGGQATYAREIALALCRAGQRVTIIAPDYGAGHEDSHGTYELRRVLVHQRVNAHNALAMFLAMREVESNHVLLTCDIRAGLLVSMLARRRAGLRVAMFHGGEILRAGKGWLPLTMNRLAVAGAHRLVANSSFSADLVRKHLARPCAAIPLGVNRYWHEKADADFDSDVLRDLPPQAQVACLVARIERRKGHAIAIEAMKRQALHQRPDFKFVFAGRAIDIDYFRELETLCKEYPATFIYAGELTRNDVRRLYRRSRLLVLPAQPEVDRIEGFGLVITEAGAQGCPCVTTHVGGIGDALTPGETGFIGAHDDLQIMGESIVRLLDDDALHARMSASASRFAQAMTWDHVVEQTFGLPSA